MNTETILQALALPLETRVDRVVPKKLLIENGAPTAADRRRIQDGVDELVWRAALKPGSIGVPAYDDATREYAEIAVLTLRLRPKALASRLTELVHRAIPYPTLLLREHAGSAALSAVHLRRSQGHAGANVLDGAVVQVAWHPDATAASDFLAGIALGAQTRTDLRTLYQSWIECLEAQAAAGHTGSFRRLTEAEAVARRRAALAERALCDLEIARLRQRAAREKQMPRRVELNVRLRELESRLAAALAQL